MMLPPPAEDRAVTAWPAPVSYTFRQEQAAWVQAVFHPSELTQTNSPPISQTFLFCKSGTRGVTNRAAGSQSGLGPPASPVMPWASQVGEMKSLNECPPLVLVYIVPSTYSPTTLLAFSGSTMTSKPSPPAGSTIGLLLLLSHDEPLSCMPPQTAVPVPPTLPALAS